MLVVVANPSVQQQMVWKRTSIRDASIVRAAAGRVGFLRRGRVRSFDHFSPSAKSSPLLVRSNVADSRVSTWFDRPRVARLLTWIDPLAWARNQGEVRDSRVVISRARSGDRRGRLCVVMPKNSVRNRHTNAGCITLFRLLRAAVSAFCGCRRILPIAGQHARVAPFSARLR